MACCFSSLSEEEKAALAESKNIEKQMQDDDAKEKAKIKLLLLGAGESGKSTIFKQMRVLYGAKLSDSEVAQYVPVVYSNVIVSMKVLLSQVQAFGYEDDVDAGNKAHFDKILAIEESAAIDTDVGDSVKALWQDPGVQKAWERRAEYQIVESVKYYFREIDRIKGDDFVPTQQDMLMARTRTSGIVTERYVIDNSNFEMYDVGGQRNERKKWIHCFDDVTAIIFVAALSEYDQALFEDATMNRMTEAIVLFKDICNNKFFTDSSMLLFLNKKDLFEEKIQKVHIGDVKDFEDFDTEMGAGNYYDKGCDYFLEKFKEQRENQEKMIYSHVTCATDTENVKIVFNACKDVILRGMMADDGLM